MLVGCGVATPGPGIDVVADAPLAGVCTPSERLCDAKDQVIVCTADGSGYSVVQGCDRGTCAHGQCDCAGPPLVTRCAGRDCGDDGCGGVCGACTAGSHCDAGACVAGCPADGTGRDVGDVMASVTYTGSDGPWSLATRCGTGNTVLVEGAIWCVSCGRAIASALAAVGGRSDVAVIALLGEAQPGVPPTSTDAAKFRAEANIPASVPIVRDPLLAATTNAVDHGEGGLPYFVVLDAGLVIRYAGQAGGAPDFPGLAAAVSLLPE